MATASEAAHGAEGAARGLPQFDPAFFASQVFWLAVTFGLLYLLLSQALLPKLEGVLAARARKIREDLDGAASANAQAQAALAGFEKTMAQARAEARALNDKVRTEADAARAEQVAAAEARLDKRLAEAEARVASAREAALAEARAAGADAAESIVARLLPPAAQSGAAA